MRLSVGLKRVEREWKGDKLLARHGWGRKREMMRREGQRGDLCGGEVAGCRGEEAGREKNGAASCCRRRRVWKERCEWESTHGLALGCRRSPQAHKHGSQIHTNTLIRHQAPTLPRTRLDLVLGLASSVRVRV